MFIIKRFLPLAAAMLMCGVGALADATPPEALSTPSSALRDVLTDAKYEPSDVDAEFADFDRLDESLGGGRRLQQTTTTERCNTWCKLKESLGLTIVGLLLVCLSPCLMWKNEGRHVNELRRIDFCKNKAIVVDNADVPSDENTGQLIHFVGKVSVDDDTLDLPSGPLNITDPLPNALVVRRTCLIYQKFEQASQETKNDVIGAGQTTTTTYTVREDWSPAGPGAAVLEHLPEESNSRGVWDELVANSGVPESAPAPSGPSGMPPEMMALLGGPDLSKAPHGVAISSSAHVGDFAITKQVVTSEPGVFQSEWMPLPSELVPDFVEPLPELRKDAQGNLTTVEEGAGPVNGDVMIKYEYAADGFDASFVVQQVLAAADPETGVPAHKFGVEKGKVLDEKCCGKISDDLGVIWMVRRGRHDLAEMISMAKEEENALTKVLRILCWVLLVAGWMMLFSIFTTLLSTLPILGTLGKAAFFIVALIVGTVCCCGVTAVAYVRYRPLVAFGILALAGAIAGIVIWRLDEANAASTAPTPAPTHSPTKRALDFVFPDDFGAAEESIY